MPWMHAYEEDQRSETKNLGIRNFNLSPSGRQKGDSAGMKGAPAVSSCFLSKICKIIGKTAGKVCYTCAEAIPYAGRAFYATRTSAWAALAQKRKRDRNKTMIFDTCPL